MKVFHWVLQFSSLLKNSNLTWKEDLHENHDVASSLNIANFYIVSDIFMGWRQLNTIFFVLRNVFHARLNLPIYTNKTKTFSMDTGVAKHVRISSSLRALQANQARFFLPFVLSFKLCKQNFNFKQHTASRFEALSNCMSWHIWNAKHIRPAKTCMIPHSAWPPWKATDWLPFCLSPT